MASQLGRGRTLRSRSGRAWAWALPSCALRGWNARSSPTAHCEVGFHPSQAPPICWFILTAMPASDTENQIKKPNAQHPRLRGAGEGGGEAGGGGGGRAGIQAGAAGLPLPPPVCGRRDAGHFPSQGSCGPRLWTEERGLTTRGPRKGSRSFQDAKPIPLNHTAIKAPSLQAPATLLFPPPQGESRGSVLADGLDTRVRKKPARPRRHRPGRAQRRLSVSFRSCHDVPEMALGLKFTTPMCNF